jgi:hypothetical protein
MFDPRGFSRAEFFLNAISGLHHRDRPPAKAARNLTALPGVALR